MFANAHSSFISHSQKGETVQYPGVSKQRNNGISVPCNTIIEKELLLKKNNMDEYQNKYVNGTNEIEREN